jgi:iron complex outermembrane receptor protein
MLNNIFNKKYEPNGSTWPYFDTNSNRVVYDNYYYPMAGTNFFAGVTIGF